MQCIPFFLYFPRNHKRRESSEAPFAVDYRNITLHYIIIIADVMKMENRGFQKTQETKVPILKCSPTHQHRLETLCPGMHLAPTSENNLYVFISNYKSFIIFFFF